MRKLLPILFVCLLPSLTKAQLVADAGADQTIYLGNSVTLTGTATNRSTSLWREVSTDYSSGATITNAGSLTATVSGLPQGTFYFELAVTSPASVVKRDTVTINVDYAPAPANSTLLRSVASKYPIMVPVVNDRTDTINTLNQSTSIIFPDGKGPVFYDRSRTNDEWIDPQMGKFYSIIEDGYDWYDGGYARSEMSFGSFYTLDTSKTYCFEWKGYFPELLVTPDEIIVIWQLHGNDGNSPPFALRPSGGNLIFSDLDHSNTKTVICSLSALVQQAHTIRITIKEGLTEGIVKVEYDGVQKYLRTTGQVGRFSDYPKFATLYDWANSVVDVNNHTRGRKFSLVTESFTVYELSDISMVAAPTIIISGGQNITVDHRNKRSSNMGK